MNACSFFSFLHVDKEQILKEILDLDSTKASQDTDIPKKILKIMQIFFQIFSFQVLIIQSQLPSFHRALNKQL